MYQALAIAEFSKIEVNRRLAVTRSTQQGDRFALTARRARARNPPPSPTLIYEVRAMSDHTHSEEVEGYDHMAEELGYRECDWSRLSEDEINRHDEVLDFEPEQLRELDLESESDLIKWAAAQAWADLDDDAAFLETALMLVRSGNNHAAIDYAEICVELLNDAIIEGDWDHAAELLDDIERLVPDDISVRARYEATIKVMRGEREEGLAMMQEILDNAGDDAGLVLAVGEDLIACEELERAKEVLDGAEELARAENDHELLEDIADAKAYIVAIESGQID
jgi:hypothetical protein